MIESFVYVAMFDGGSGTEEDPFLVGDGTHLFNVREYLSDGKYFRQTAGIDLNRHFGEDKGGWDPIGHIELPFIGFYDGGNHTISNLYIYNSYFYNGDYTGLFAYIGENSEIGASG